MSNTFDTGEERMSKKSKNPYPGKESHSDNSAAGPWRYTMGERWAMPNHTLPMSSGFVLPEITYGNNLSNTLHVNTTYPVQPNTGEVAHPPQLGTGYVSYPDLPLLKSAYENGERNPSMEVARRVSDVPRKRKRPQKEHTKVVIDLSPDSPTARAILPRPAKREASFQGGLPEVIDLLSSDSEGPSSDIVCRTAEPPRIQKATHVTSFTQNREPNSIFSQSEEPQYTPSNTQDSTSTLNGLDASESRSESKQSAQVKDVVPITEPELCKEQADLVDLIVRGNNVFYTGSAGCGKSTVLKAFVKRLRERGLQVDIVAPTGRAALDINGSTTWTYAGWTPNHHGRPLKTLKAAAHGKFVQRRLKATDVLVIDEISMVENLHFERLNEVMKEARGNDLAFGGVQLVVTGDFCQLPPVKPFGHCIKCGKELRPNSAKTEFTCPLDSLVYYLADQYAFRSKAWKEANFAHVNLSNIHRQSDAVFINILQKCRMGKALSQADMDLLLHHPSETRGAVKLFSTREEVRRINLEAFNKLRSRPRAFKSLDTFIWNEQHRNLEFKTERMPDGSLKALHDHRFDSTLLLKQGMNVVLLVNLDVGAGLVNGSQGTIQGFEQYDPQQLPKTSENASKAPSVTKEGVPMPPVPTLSGDHATFREEQIKNFITSAENKEWPIVQFNNGVRRTIYADCTVNELGDEQPHSLLSRTQIPLTAAWALSIHKSQGMTLNRVIVDLSKSFEDGQMYVALSRARSLDGLKVEGLGRGMKGGSEEVKEFLWEKFGIR